MNLTVQQTAFIEALLNTTSNLALIARAGCGKTTTIIQAALAYHQKFPQAEILICAFANAINKEIGGKLEKLNLDWRKVQSSTVHGMGFGLLKFAFKLSRNDVDDKKVWNLINQQNGEVYSLYASQIKEMVHLGKVEGFGFFDDVAIGDAHAWYKMAEHYSINGFEDTSDMDSVIEAAQHIYRASLAQTNIIDFDDMILFPLVKNIRVKFQKDLIFIDEAQDTSRARRALVRKFLKQTGRVVSVGDDRQAIMGFAGASADAMDELVADTSAIALPLTVTWRCPKSVVQVAQTIVPDIQYADTAIEGEVIKLDAIPMDSMLSTDAILCRNTAPLVSTAYSLIRKGVACKVEGRSIGDGLLKLVNRWKLATIAAFLDKLDDWSEREIQKAQAKGKDSKVEEINDRRETLQVICQAVLDKGNTSLDGVREFIGAMFGDNVTGVVTLATYHRSKGREWPRVMLLEHTKRCPSKWAKQAWEQRQEANLAYVAITRAQQSLVFVG